MRQVYSGSLRAIQIEWDADSPKPSEPGAVGRVEVTVLDDQGSNGNSGKKMAAALQRIAESSGTKVIADPSDWQREVRRDRTLPER